MRALILHQGRDRGPCPPCQARATVARAAAPPPSRPPLRHDNTVSLGTRAPAQYSGTQCVGLPLLRPGRRSLLRQWLHLRPWQRANSAYVPLIDPRYQPDSPDGTLLSNQATRAHSSPHPPVIARRMASGASAHKSRPDYPRPVHPAAGPTSPPRPGLGPDVHQLHHLGSRTVHRSLHPCTLLADSFFQTQLRR